MRSWDLALFLFMFNFVLAWFTSFGSTVFGTNAQGIVGQKYQSQSLCQAPNGTLVYDVVECQQIITQNLSSYNPTQGSYSGNLFQGAVYLFGDFVTGIRLLIGLLQIIVGSTIGVPQTLYMLVCPADTSVFGVLGAAVSSGSCSQAWAQFSIIVGFGVNVVYMVGLNQYISNRSFKSME